VSTPPPWRRRRRQAGRPEDAARPRQIAERARVALRDRRHPPAPVERGRLPWGLEINYHPQEIIGSSIRRLGLFDLLASEVLLRLPAPGELVVDGGANIGHMSGLLALATGPGGQVLAVEPHPEVAGELRANVEHWRGDPRLGEIEVIQVALSDGTGRGRLLIPADFSANRGSARLGGAADGAGPSTQPDSDPDPGAYEVTLTSLDQLCGERPVGVLKLDIEGHELPALHGAAELLGSRRVRDILFEENTDVPSPVTELLEDAGYTVLGLEVTVRGPRARSLADGPPRTTPEQPLYLATTESVRALDALGVRGWRALRGRRSPRPLRGIASRGCSR